MRHFVRVVTARAMAVAARAWVVAAVAQMVAVSWMVVQTTIRTAGVVVELRSDTLRQSVERGAGLPRTASRR